MLMLNQVREHWWQIILVDLIMELPQSHGYNAIMVVVDWLSKHAHMVLTTANVTMLGVAQLFRDHVQKLHGLPEEVISNWGTQFLSNFTHNLSQLFGIRVAASTAHHPQTNGQNKWVNKEVEQFLWPFKNQCQDDWYEWVLIAKFTYTTKSTFQHAHPLHVHHQKEPPVEHGTTQGIPPQNPEQPCLQADCSNKWSMLSSH